MNGERRLVGALLLDSSRITELAGKLTASDFFFPEYRTTFAAMCELQLGGHPVSVETVASHLNRNDANNKNLLSSIGGQQTIAACLNSASPDELDFWVTETIKFRKKREMAAAMDKYRERLIDSADPDKLRAEMEEALVRMDNNSESADITHISLTTEALRQRVAGYIENPDGITGLQTGWQKWDRTLDGLRPGNVAIVYAKSSRYKSLFVQNMGHLFAMSGAAGLWYTSEMGRIEVEERLLQIETGLNLRNLRKTGSISQYQQAIESGLDTLDKLPIFWSEGFGLAVSKIRAEVKRHKRWNNIQYVIVDLVDHVESNKYANDVINQQAHIMRSLKDIAKREDVAIVAISHVAKGDKIDARKVELDVEDMKGSSAKYQDVDYSICIVPVNFGIPPEKRGRSVDDHWYGLTREEISESVRNLGHVDVMITITKNRHGETGRFVFRLDTNEGGRFYPQDD